MEISRRFCTNNARKLLAGLGYLSVGFLLVAMAFEPALAQSRNLGEIATNTGDVSKDFAGAFFSVISLVGVVLAGVGIYKIVMAKKTNEPMGLGIAMALGGSLMLVLPIIINATTQTAVRADAGGLDRLELTND